MNPRIVAVLKHFSYKHLPPHLMEVSGPFCDLAEKLVQHLHPHGPDEAQLEHALQRLLEAKDAAVRAALASTLHAKPAAE